MAQINKYKLNIGYASIRTSTEGIREQLDILDSIGCKTIYKDLAFSHRDERPGLHDLLVSLKKGSVIYTKSFFNIFSTLKSFSLILDVLKAKESELVIIDEDIKINKNNADQYSMLWSELVEFREKSQSRRITE